MNDEEDHRGWAWLVISLIDQLRSVNEMLDSVHRRARGARRAEDIALAASIIYASEPVEFDGRLAPRDSDDLLHLAASAIEEGQWLITFGHAVQQRAGQMREEAND